MNLKGCLFLFLLFVKPLIGQNTVGLLSADLSKAFDGYNLFYPHNQSTVFLINNCGEIVHTWQDEKHFRPGNTAYLLENGNLIKTKRANVSINDPIWAGGGGDMVEIRDWDNILLWRFEQNDSLKRLHHDVAVLPNGNVLMISWELKTETEAIQAGRKPSLLPQGKLWPDYVLEVDPNTNEVVWEWHVWDHLIQDFDPSRDNYGDVAEHPELVDINWDTSEGHPDWMHSNAIDYNPELDQILLSVPTFSEVWVIDHSTTPEEAAGHTGGRSGKGGDLLYRWGNPAAYKSGAPSDQKLFYPHDIHWTLDFLDASHPHYGKIAAFNNQVNPNYSTANVFDPPFDRGNWSYRSSTTGWGPLNFDLTIFHPDTTKMNSDGLSSVQFLPNENVLICSGRQGYSFELTSENEIVWEYVTPLLGGSPVSQGTMLNPGTNVTFRMNRYPAYYEAFEGKDLRAKGFIETNPGTGFCGAVTSTSILSDKEQLEVYPNPAFHVLNMEWKGREDEILQVFNVFGQEIRKLRLMNGNNSLDISDWPRGFYMIRTASGEGMKILKSQE